MATAASGMLDASHTRSRRLCRLVVVTAASLFLDWQPVLAQEDFSDLLTAGPGPEASGPVERTGTRETRSPDRAIEEIVVTAQKTEQSLQDVPISISALDGELLRDANLTDFNEVARYLPNTVFVENGSEPNMSIRGFTTDSFNSGAENSVGLVIDDVALGRHAYFAAALFDLERLELLRGPQGTVFGKSTTAGVFNLVSKAPTDEWTGSIVLRGGSDRQAEGGIGGPLTETLSARMSFLYEDDGETLRNTFLDEDYGGLDRHAGRLKLRWRPTENVEVEVFGLTSRTVSHLYQVQYQRLTESARDFLDDFDPRIEDDGENDTLSFDQFSETQLETQIFGGRVVVDWGDAGVFRDLSSTLIVGGSELDGSVHGDIDFGPADILRFPTATNDMRMRQLELRLAGRAPGPFAFGGIEFLSGVFFSSESFAYVLEASGGDDLDAYLLSGPALEAAGIPAVGIGCPTCPLPSDLPTGTAEEDGLELVSSADAKALGLFGQAIYRPIDPLALTAGLRLDVVRKESPIFARPYNVADPNTAGVIGSLLGYTTSFQVEPKIRETALSPRLSAQYDLFGGDVTAFFTWARGFKSGAFDWQANSPSADFTADPEFVTSYDAGFKGMFLDRAIRWNTTFFHMDFEDLQVLVPIQSAVPFFRLENAASATSRGVEMDATYLPGFAPWLTVTGAVAYLDARYDSFPNGPARVGSGEPTQDLSGKTYTLAPKWTGLLSPVALIPLPDLPFLEGDYGAAFGIDATFRSAYFTDVALNPEARIDPSVALNGRLSFGPASELWRLTLNVANLTNELRHESSNPDYLFSGSYYGYRGVPRKITADVTFRW